MLHILLHICFGTFYKAIKYVVIVTLPVVTKRLVKIWIPSSIHHLSISLTVNLYGYLSTSNLNVSCLSWTVVHRETLYYSINYGIFEIKKKAYTITCTTFFFLHCDYSKYSTGCRIPPNVWFLLHHSSSLSLFLRKPYGVHEKKRLQ